MRLRKVLRAWKTMWELADRVNIYAMGKRALWKAEGPCMHPSREGRKLSSSPPSPSVVPVERSPSCCSAMHSRELKGRLLDHDELTAELEKKGLDEGSGWGVNESKAWEGEVRVRVELDEKREPLEREPEAGQIFVFRLFLLGFLGTHGDLKASRVRAISFDGR